MFTRNIKTNKKPVSFLCEDGAGEHNNVETHPLQLDADTSSASLQTLSDVNTELKKGSRDTDTLAPGNYGACLTLNDHDHIRQFVQEFTFRGLLPHVEKNIRQLNDQVSLRLYSWGFLLQALSVSKPTFYKFL